MNYINTALKNMILFERMIESYKKTTKICLVVPVLFFFLYKCEDPLIEQYYVFF